MITEAIEGYLESLEADGDPISAPVEVGRVTVGGEPSARPAVSVPPPASPAVQTAGLTQRTLANRPKSES